MLVGEFWSIMDTKINTCVCVLRLVCINWCYW